MRRSKKNIPLQLLDLDRLLGGNGLVRLSSLLIAALVDGVDAIQDAEAQARHPSLVRLDLQSLGRSAGPHAGGVEVGEGVEQHVAAVAELAAGGAEADDGVECLCVVGGRGGAEVLDELADAHGFTHDAEVGL